MRFDWTPEQDSAYHATLKAVRESFAEPRPEGYFSRKDWLRLGELGLLGLSIPAEFGGGGLGALDTAHRVEALGRGTADTGLVFAASAHLFACAMPLAGFGSEPAKRRFLPGLASGELIAGNAMTEDEAGSDVSRLATTATTVPGGFVLNGVKSFVSNGPVADLYVTYATTDPDAGHLGRTAFVVERSVPGVRAGEPLEKMGLASVPAGQVFFEGCFVPNEQVLGVPGQGGAIFQDSMGWERACLFAGYVGLLDRLLERSVRHARSRRQFGSAIGDFQAVANRIVEMKLRLESARLLLYRACWEMDAGRPSACSIALSKLAVSEAAVAGALDGVRLFGALGYLREPGIETMLRDTVPATIFSGTSDIQRLVIAKELGL
jgi:alkylation response protein AidB-like acyl-CoA dehydrogenase